MGEAFPLFTFAQDLTVNLAYRLSCGFVRHTSGSDAEFFTPSTAKAPRQSCVAARTLR
jgi:hypothetical protein